MCSHVLDERQTSESVNMQHRGMILRLALVASFWPNGFALRICACLLEIIAPLTVKRLSSVNPQQNRLRMQKW